MIQTFAPTLSDRRSAFWATREQGRHAEAVAIWSAYLAWQLAPGNLSKPPSVYLNWLVEGQEAPPSTGSLYDTFDRGRALQLGYSGNLTRLAQIGRAVREGTPRSQIDALTPAELAQNLRGLNLSNAESKEEVLTPRREENRAHLRDADPEAPTNPVEADALNQEALSVIAKQLAPVYRAAVQAAQTGDMAVLSNLAAATLPPRYIEWGKQRGTCWACALKPDGGEIYDAHHVAIGDHEARRNDGGPEKFAFLHRACHIPQPFSPIVTAHSKAFSVGRDPDRLIAFIEYDAIQHEAYEKFIRGES